MSIVLPTPENNSGPNEWSDVYSNDKALKEALEAAEAEISTLKSVTHPVAWYTPQVIATEESRTNTAFGTLTTPDEITGVVVPANALVAITYSAFVKSSVSAAGTVGLFIGSNQILVPHSGIGPTVVAGQTNGTSFGQIVTSPAAEAFMGSFGNSGSGAATGAVINAIQIGQLAADTYAIGARFKASSGSVTAKERYLSVAVFGH